VPENGRIAILPPEEAMRIAAGEVIDRPAALVREFLDNAIDAGSLNIEVSIEEGGCKKVEVSDDGGGMTREDLAICSLTHATSKIRCLDDLTVSRTLGFRGEALAAACAVARLEIICSVDGREAWRLDTGPGESHSPTIEQTRRTKGTTVRALNLYETIPARKRFLKREGSEASLCRQIFIEKALAFNGINFRYVQDGKLKDFLPAVKTKKERFASAVLQHGEENFLHEINVTGDGFSATIVIGGPELYRNDRRQLYIFANGRRVQDYSLVQAVEYGFQGWFPNGTHPVAAVYVEIDPSLADFNIHPAKREVRFRDPGAIHQAISGGVKNFFHSLYLKNSRKDKESATGDDQTEKDNSLFPNNNSGKNHSLEEHDNISNNNSASSATLRLSESSFSLSSLNEKSSFPRINDKFFTSQRNRENPSSNTSPAYGDMRYAGRIFDLFILMEWGDKLYIIDQHAAHERILYNKFLKEPIPKQELLAPITFTTESDEEDAFLSANSEELSRLGVEIKKDGNSWNIEALPADWRMGDSQTVKEILELRTAGENMAKRWAATCCCRAAIKDGDILGDETAFELGREALLLPDPRCPHGRPVWTEISREALFKAVRRE